MINWRRTRQCSRRPPPSRSRNHSQHGRRPLLSFMFADRKGADKEAALFLGRAHLCFGTRGVVIAKVRLFAHYGGGGPQAVRPSDEPPGFQGGEGRPPGLPL